MYAIIRKYKSERVADATRSAGRQFAHSLRQAPGLVNYYVIEGDGEWATVSVFKNKQAADRAAAMAAEFMRREGAENLVGEPEITAGEVALHVQ